MAVTLQVPPSDSSVPFLWNLFFPRDSLSLSARLSFRPSQERPLLMSTFPCAVHAVLKGLLHAPPPTLMGFKINFRENAVSEAVLPCRALLFPLQNVYWGLGYKNSPWASVLSHS